MLDEKLLADLLSVHGMTREELASRLGLTLRDFDWKILSGTLGLREAEMIIRELQVSNPERLFFPVKVT